MNILTSISFINAASIPFAQVFLDGNTLLVGANGAGKTTVLRSSLYFYGVQDNKALGINITKKRGFRDYYFEKLNSYIVYRYTNEHHNMMVIAYRTANSSVKFKFVVLDEPIEDKDLFLEGNTARTSDELWKYLKEHNYTVSNAINTQKEYKDILYGQSTLYKAYAFFQTKEDYTNFIHVLSNVFINSKLDASSIQKTISSVIQGFEPIDLERIEYQINTFNQQYHDVKNFDKHRQLVEDIIKDYANYQNYVQSMKENVDIFFANLEQFEKQLSMIEEMIQEIQKEQTEHDTSYKTTKTTYKNATKEVSDTLAILHDKIKETVEKQNYYENLDIHNVVKRSLTQQSVEREHARITQEYESLTAKNSSVTQKFNEQKEIQRKAQEQEKQVYETSKLQLDQHASNEIQTLNNAQQLKLDQLDQDSKEQIETLEEQIEQAQNTKDKALENFHKTKNSRLYEQQLNNLNAGIQELSTQQNTLKSQLQQDRNSVQAKSTQIEQIELTLSKSIETVELNFQHTLEKQHTQQKRIQELLDISKESFLSFVRECKHPKEELICSLMKDELLVSTTLKPSFVEGNNTFFGFDLETSHLNTSLYSKEALQEQLEAVNQVIQTLKSDFTLLVQSKENETRNQINALRRDQRQLQDAILDKEQQLPRLEVSLHTMIDEKKTLETKAKEQMQENVQKAQAVVDETTTLVEHKKTDLKACKQHNEKAKQEAREHFEHKHLALKTEYKKALLSLTNAYDSVKKSLIEKMKVLELEEKTALENGGIDSTKLSQLQEQLQSLDTQLQIIKNEYELVTEYKIDTKNYFDTLEVKQNDLAAAQKTLETLNQTFNEAKKAYSTQKTALTQALDRAQKQQESILSDIEQKEEIFKANLWLQKFIQDHTPTPAQCDTRSLRNILDKIISLNNQNNDFVENMRTQQEVLFTHIKPFNALHLTLPKNSQKQSILDSANELEYFMRDDKLSLFKQEVSSNFAQTINHLSRQTQSLLEAKGNVQSVVNSIRKLLKNLEGINVIDSIDIRVQESNNPILAKLEHLKTLNETMSVSSQPDLFSYDKPQASFSQSIKTIEEIRKQLDKTNATELLLDDTYVLELRASENGNDTKWQTSLNEVGSNGTDVMIKTIVNISLLYTSLKTKKIQTSFHCILDEIGVLHPSYLKELIAFANAKNIYFLNGAPNSQQISSFKRIYILKNDHQNTTIKALLSKYV